MIEVVGTDAESLRDKVIIIRCAPQIPLFSGTICAPKLPETPGHSGNSRAKTPPRRVGLAVQIRGPKGGAWNARDARSHVSDHGGWSG